MVKLARLQPTHVQILDEFSPLSHVVWAAMEKIGRKELNPKLLTQGARHLVALRVEGEVDSQPFRQKLTSVITIGHEQERSSSVNPQVPELVAYILSKLNAVTRTKILAEIPGDFVANANQLPASNPILVDEAKQMLKKLRQTKTVIARGPIRCEYDY